ncbi:hypothetical protein V9T40_008464 [Parthenolecanium corni]|uniref:LanC-like protein 2 n=1 Tax=Parthenolecanium corni TaxID=536013 RepID=A0AAN9Y5Y9_9HEMI
MAAFSNEAAKRFYVNEFNDYVAGNSENISVIGNQTGYNPNFGSQLINVIEELSRFLDSNKRQALKCNERIYAGLSGIALLNFLNHTRNNSLGCISRNRTIREAKVKILEYAEKLKVKDSISFLSGDAGILALAAVFFHKRNDHSRTASCIQKLLSCSKYALSFDLQISDELLYGRAGYLYALLFVRKNLPSRHIPESLIVEVINAIINSGKSEAARSPESHKPPLKFKWHSKEYVGAAHGYCGILHSLLLARRENFISDEDMLTYVKPTIDYVLDLQYPSKNIPSSVNSTSYDILVQWCHGAPGAIHMVSLAYELFREEKYFRAAIEFGEVTWNRGILTKGYSLCHGVAGNGYTFLKLYQLTGDRKYLHRATKFAEWCFRYGTKQTFQPDRPWSLFEGISGIIYFLVDLLQPTTAKFPGVEL